MALLFLSIVIVAFVLFFYGIGLRYLGLIPLLFVGMFFAYYGATQSIKVEGSALLKKYALYISRVIIMAGIFGMLNYFGMEPIYSALGLLTFNLVLRMGSILMDYKDGTVVFQLGFYLSTFFILMIAFAFGGLSLLLSVFSMLRVLHLGIIAFIIFLIGHYKGVEKYLRYKLVVISLGTIFLVVFDQIQNIYLAIALNSVILTGLYYFITKVFDLRPQSEEQKKEISVRRILAGERITAVKKQFRAPRMEQLHRFVESMPGATKRILESFNILLVLILIVTYIFNISGFVDASHLFYWITIVAFVVNVLLLKRVGYNSIIQNLVVFLVINFAIYVSLFSYFNGSMGAVATWWIIRNIFSAAMIFYTHRVPMLAKIFGKTDYIYRIISCIAAMVVNVIVLLYTGLPGELIFFLVLVYVGLQSMIIYYAAKYLSKISVLN